MLLISWKTTER